MRLIAILLLAASLPGWAFAHAGEDHGSDEKPTAAHVPLAPRAISAGSTALPTEVSQRLPDGSLFVPKPVQRSLGIRTVAAQKGEFPRVIELPGRVIADPNAGGRVQATQAGTIGPGPGGLALIGQRVTAGQVLAMLMPTLDASSRADKQSSLAELTAQTAMLERRLARLKQLEGSVPRKDIEQLRIELTGLKARRSALAGALGGRIALTAPVSGVVAASQVVVGQVVEAREILYEIVDPRRLAVEALAFDRLPLAGFGKASARIGEAIGPPIALDFVGAGRSLREQALPIIFRIRVAANDEAPVVAVGQTLKVFAETAERRSGVAVPISALSRNGANEVIIWVHERAEHFVPRRVRTISLDAQRVLVLDGLAGDERIVAQGAQALNQLR